MQNRQKQKFTWLDMQKDNLKNLKIQNHIRQYTEKFGRPDFRHYIESKFNIYVLVKTHKYDIQDISDNLNLYTFQINKDIVYLKQITIFLCNRQIWG